MCIKTPHQQILPQKKGPDCYYLQICAIIYLSQHSEKSTPESVSVVVPSLDKKPLQVKAVPFISIMSANDTEK